MISVLSNREKRLFELEVKQFFRHRRVFHFVPLLGGALVMMAWIYPVGSPFAPVIIAVFLGLELQFNNIFFRTSKELEAMTVFALPWERLVLVKNLATITLTTVLLIISSMALLYFSPGVLSPDKIWNALCYCSTVIFPLLHWGNGQSIRKPRRESGLKFEDLIEAIWMAVTLLIVSVPSFIIIEGLRMPTLCLVYGAGTWLYWYTVSVPITGYRIGQEQVVICSNQ